jgi:hypothetical protein
MNNNYYDYIYDLPVDKHKQQNEVEIELLRTLFKKNQSFFTVVLKESYESFLVALLFLLFTIPYTENIIKSIFPVTENLTVLLIVIKFICVMIAYWIMKQSLF